MNQAEQANRHAPEQRDGKNRWRERDLFRSFFFHQHARSLSLSLISPSPQSHLMFSFLRNLIMADKSVIFWKKPSTKASVEKFVRMYATHLPDRLQMRLARGLLCQ